METDIVNLSLPYIKMYIFWHVPKEVVGLNHWESLELKHFRDGYMIFPLEHELTYGWKL